MNTSISKLSRSLLAVLLTMVLGSLNVHAQTRSKEIRLRPTHEGLLIQSAGGPVMKGAVGTVVELDPTSRVLEEGGAGLLGRSTILAFGGNWTLVPNDAVIYVPAGYADRVLEKPEGTLLSWARFYEKNRGWLHAQPVRMSDARGDTVLKKSMTESHHGLGRVVVAVFRGGPISVCPKSEAFKRNPDQKDQ